MFVNIFASQFVPYGKPRPGHGPLQLNSAISRGVLDSDDPRMGGLDVYAVMQEPLLGGWRICNDCTLPNRVCRQQTVCSGSGRSASALGTSELAHVTSPVYHQLALHITFPVLDVEVSGSGHCGHSPSSSRPRASGISRIACIAHLCFQDRIGSGNLSILKVIYAARLVPLLRLLGRSDCYSIQHHLAPATQAL